MECQENADTSRQPSETRCAYAERTGIQHTLFPSRNAEKTTERWQGHRLEDQADLAINRAEKAGKRNVNRSAESCLCRCLQSCRPIVKRMAEKWKEKALVGKTQSRGVRLVLYVNCAEPDVLSSLQHQWLARLRMALRPRRQATMISWRPSRI